MELGTCTDKRGVGGDHGRVPHDIGLRHRELSIHDVREGPMGVGNVTGRDRNVPDPVEVGVVIAGRYPDEDA